MDEPFKHAESKVQETKDHVLHNSIYMKSQNRHIHRDKQINGWLGQRMAIDKKNGYDEFLWGDGHVDKIRL